LAYSLEVRVEIYKDATEKSLALAQKYLDSSGSKKQEFAEEEAKKLDSESEDKSKGITRGEEFANKATKYLKQAKASANLTKRWRKSLNNENHYQAMRNDTENVYFYRVKSRDAAGRLTGHIVGNGLSTEQEYSPASGHLYTIKSNFNSTNQIRNLEYEYDLMDNVTQRQNVLLDFLINLAKVLSGDGGVVTASCLYFLVNLMSVITVTTLLVVFVRIPLTQSQG
jgi:hypothetical protein